MPVRHRIEIAVASPFRRRVDATLLRDAVAAALASRRLRIARAVSLSVTDTRTLRRLNRRYRGRDEATDVLAFGTGIPGLRGPDGVEQLGAVVIALPLAARDARAWGMALVDTLALLAIHGTLHLLGCDHATRRDATAMRRLERAALERVGRPQAAR